MISTPTNTLEVLNGSLPLTLRLKLLQSKFYIKCLFKNENEVVDAIKNLDQQWPDCTLSKVYHSITQNSFESRTWKSYKFGVYSDYLKNLNVDLSYRKEMSSNKSLISNLEHGAIFRKVMSKYKNIQHVIYTDGSKSETHAGFAFSHEGCSIHNWSLNIYSSIFECEAYAIQEALHHILFSHPTGNVLIVSDSLSVILSIVSKKHPANLPSVILQIREYINIFQDQNRNLNILWVPSHVQIAGNEAVDVAARAMNSRMFPNQEIGIAIRVLKFDSQEIWQHEWENGDKGRYLFRILPSLKSSKMLNTVAKINTRSQIGVFNRMLSGHTRVLGHLKRIGVVDSDICSCNTAIQHCNHLFFDCPHLNRSELIEYLTDKLKLTPPFRIENILSNIDSIETINHLWRFIQNNKIVI